MATVVASSAGFGLLAAALAWFAAAQRHAGLQRVLPQLKASDDAANTVLRQRFPTGNWTGTDWGTFAPDPDLGAVLGHAATQTLVFAAALAAVAVLVRRGRAVYALPAVAALVTSILTSVGPMGLLPGTLYRGLEITPGSPALPPGVTPVFGAPLWWRLVSAVGVVAVLAAAAWLVNRGRPRLSVGTSPLTLVLVPYLGAVVLLSVWLGAASTDGNPGSWSAILLLTYVGLGTTAAAAGASAPTGTGLSAAVTLASLAGFAAVMMSALHGAEGGAPTAYGWGVMGNGVPAYGTTVLALLVIAAAPYGLLAGAAATGLHRPASRLLVGSRAPAR